MPNGNLDSWLHHESRNLSFRQRLDIAIDFDTDDGIHRLCRSRIWTRWLHVASRRCVQLWHPFPGDVHGKETNRTHVSGWFEPSQFLEDGIARTGDGDCRFKLGWGVR
ncbi:unnamed protein product, partial [Vitis vinifera]